MAAVSVSGEASRAQPGMALDIDMDAHGGKQTQQFIIWQWAQERKFNLTIN